MGRSAILAAAGTGPLDRRLARVTETTGAGGGCGSCRHQIRSILSEATPHVEPV
ncbi:bacterioferritin-associated ferredoxin [Tistrella mobilis]|uniref:BFD-like [2Fe-2S]-binding domain-containing protein n=1 Tax=Tistrella mobilis (strain KA081020-065) TaxID=1110502 RepID=I3TMK1_TISMK|nr:(2Fe-2S)-binding protein [Tistrella mobilis]AFK53989.1 hypothetical protein TMO_2151 [Tistrella mobilis KA081020-065]